MDAAGLGAFRAVFGAVAFVSTIRFIAKGWVSSLYLEPTVHFHYWGFEWVRPWPAPGMYAHYGIMALGALALALGWHARVAAAIFGALFTYAELIDKATYLNHYYLVSLLAFWLAAVPCDRALAIRQSRCPSTVPKGVYTALRVQVGLVYFFAGLAKLNSDWLIQAQPLSIWLAGYGHWPIVGSLMAEPWTAYLMSWGGALFDLSVPFALIWRRTRKLAYIAVIGFHSVVGLLFPIGVFPFVMMGAATIFFAPGWPRRWIPRPDSGDSESNSGRLSLAWRVCVAAVLAVQLILPLRWTLYPGHDGWTGDGYRFAWRVMLNEKVGWVEYRLQGVDSNGRAASRRVLPAVELHRWQVKQLGIEPDMIAEYARHLREKAEAEGLRDVRVFADAFASINGRPSQRLVDPAMDLSRQEPSLAPTAWVVELE